MSFHNDGQFPTSQESLSTILSNYGIQDFSYSVATSGIENTTCVIETPKRKYALRIYRQAKKPIDAIKHELAFMDMLRRQGLPVPGVYVNQTQQAITQVDMDGKQWEALLMECMSGDHPSSYTTSLLSQMAQAQATMHESGTLINKSHHDLPEPTSLVEGEFVRHIDRNSISNNARLLKYIERIAKYEVTLDANLPRGFSHFDFDLGNILIDNNGNLSAILDFDDLQYAPFVVCLGYTLWSVLYETGDESIVAQYLAEYQKTRQLGSLEREYLPKIMLFRHYVITALKILNGHIAKDDVQNYEALGSQLIRINL